MMKDVFKFSIPGKPEYIQMARLAISSVADKAGFDMEQVEDIRLSVDEACKNITCHGHDGYSECYIVEGELTDAAMTITVEDTCCPHLVDKHGKHVCLKCPEGGEVALAVIRTLMDSAQVVQENGVKKIIMVKNKK